MPTSPAASYWFSCCTRCCTGWWFWTESMLWYNGLPWQRWSHGLWWRWGYNGNFCCGWPFLPIEEYKLHASILYVLTFIIFQLRSKKKNVLTEKLLQMVTSNKTKSLDLIVRHDTAVEQLTFSILDLDIARLSLTSC